MTKNHIAFAAIFSLFISYHLSGQAIKAPFSYQELSQIENVDKAEVKWLKLNLNEREFRPLAGLLSKLSRPSAIQLLPAYSFYDGSYNGPVMSRNMIDSLYIRPADGNAGLVHAAFLIEKIRMQALRSTETGMTDNFTGRPLVTKKVAVPANQLNLSFDFSPANTILHVISSPGITYDLVRRAISNHYFDAIIGHRNQSFYPFPFTREKIVYCLLKAASNEPLDSLYRYMNPRGLLHFAEVKKDINKYREIIKALDNNQRDILDEIKATVLPFTPGGTITNRKVSLYFGWGADGWANGDVTAMDLEYYKDDYANFISVLKHETFHTIQGVVSLKNEIHDARYKPLQDIMDGIFLEGTATFVSDPSHKTPGQFNTAVQNGKQLFAKAMDALRRQDKNELASAYNQGVRGAGPFYSLGSEMTKTIVTVLGNNKLKEILPQGSVAFFKAYAEAIKSNKNVLSLFTQDDIAVFNKIN